MLDIWEWYKARGRVVQVLIAGLVFLIVLITLIPAAGQEAPSEPEAKKRADKEQAESQVPTEVTEEVTREVTREVTVNEGLGKAGEEALRQDLERAEQAAADAEAQNEDLEARVSDLQAQIDELEDNQLQAQGPIQQQPSGTGTKHVTVKVSSNIPVDVLIWDDNFDADISEEITGKQTYEFDIAKNSGLLAEASNLDQAGNIYVGVYEDGQLVAEDRDPQYAQISY